MFAVVKIVLLKDKNFSETSLWCFDELKDAKEKLDNETKILELPLNKILKKTDTELRFEDEETKIIISIKYCGNRSFEVVSTEK